MCWLLGWSTAPIGTLAAIVAALPLAWSALALIWPATWLERQASGARDPSPREQQLVEQALARLAVHDPRRTHPHHLAILDADDANAWILGREVTLHRGLLEHPDFAAVLAHELGHLHARDGVHTLALNRLAFWPGLLSGRPAGRGRAAKPAAGAELAASGELSHRITVPVWAAHWRDQEHLADRYAQHLGQGPALADYLHHHALLDDLPVPFAWMTDIAHPPTEQRIANLATRPTPPMPSGVEVGRLRALS